MRLSLPSSLNGGFAPNVILTPKNIGGKNLPQVLDKYSAGTETLLPIVIGIRVTG